MTTVATIIFDALRQSNLIPINGTVTTQQQEEALRHLSRILKSVIGNEVGENLIDRPVGTKNVSYGIDNRWHVGGDFIVPKNVRLVCGLDEETTVYLDPMPEDGQRVSAIDVSLGVDSVVTYQGQTLLVNGQPIAYDEAFPALIVDGNGRIIEGSTEVQLDTSGFNIDWMYRADLGQWVRLTPISSVNDTFPFPESFDIFFITMLAMSLNPAYGTQMDPQTQAMFQRSKTQFRARYHPQVPVSSEIGLLRAPKTAADRTLWTYGWYGYDPTNAFNKGTIW